MPLIQVVTNSVVSDKEAFLKNLTEVLAATLKIPATHIHVHLQDAQCLSFGGEFKPAAYIVFKSAAQQVREGKRKETVDKIMPLLQEHIGAEPSRVTTFFEDLPVENIAVGSSVIVFNSPPVSPSS